MHIKTFVQRNPALSYFALAVLWSYIYWQILFTFMPVNPTKGPTALHIMLAGLGGSPSLFGILLIYLVNGREGLRDLLSRSIRWRVGLVWYIAAFLIPLGLNAVTYTLYPLLGATPYPILLENIIFGISAGMMSPLLEEFGWRGFALPTLQRRFTPFISSLIVGLGWGLWHLRLNVTMMESGDALINLLLSPWGPLGLSALSVLMAWVHNSSRNSMLLMIIFHFSITSSFFFFGPPADTASSEILRHNLLSLVILWISVGIVITLAREKNIQTQPAV